MKAIVSSAKFWGRLLFSLGLLISAREIVNGQAVDRSPNQPLIQVLSPIASPTASLPASLPGSPTGSPVVASSVSPAGSEELLADDGTFETAVSGNSVIAVNRLTPSAYPATLQIIRLMFPQVTNLPSPVGSQITLIAFAGASGTTQPPANPVLLVNQTVTIPTATASSGFVDFVIQNGPTISAGDFYVGFKTPNPFGGVVYATDTDGTPRQRAFVSADNGVTFTGPLTFPGTSTPVNLLIRAVVMNDAQPVPRITAAANLNFGSSELGVTQQQNLTISNTGGAALSISNITTNNAQFTVAPTTFPLAIAAGAQAQVTVRFTPSSLGLQTGTLTIASNDPSTPSAIVALSGVGGILSGPATVFLNSGASVTGSVIAPSGGLGVLLTTQYAIFVPPGATQLKIDLTGDQDVDLFARFNQRIVIAGGNLIADYGSIQDGIVPESITVTSASSPALQSGLYYIAIANFGPGAANFTLTATITGGTAPAVVTTVSAASFLGTTAAGEQIVAFFGSNLATGTQVANVLPLPPTLLGTTVKVRDNVGTERLAPLFFVSPGQVNALIPAGTVNDSAQIVITSGDGKIAVGTISVASVSPGLFTANANGAGVPAATVLRVKADGSQTYEALSRFDTAQNSFVPVPIDLGAATDQVFLILNGTGVRGRSSLSAVTATIGGVAAPVVFAGVQGDFVGLDQINVGIPRSLIGRGNVDVILTVDGKIANTVKINIK